MAWRLVLARSGAQRARRRRSDSRCQHAHSLSCLAVITEHRDGGAADEGRRALRARPSLRTDHAQDGRALSRSGDPAGVIVESLTARARLAAPFGWPPEREYLRISTESAQPRRRPHALGAQETRTAVTENQSATSEPGEDIYIGACGQGGVEPCRRVCGRRKRSAQRHQPSAAAAHRLPARTPLRPLRSKSSCSAPGVPLALESRDGGTGGTHPATRRQ